jgi:tetratricopeptide (TPR) repeat protein
MTALVCSKCGKAASGSFCQECGAKVGGHFCQECGAQISAIAKYCNRCGTRASVSEHRAAATATIGGKNLPWWIAGAAMFALIVALATQMMQPGGPSSPSASPVASQPGGGAVTGTPPDLSSMTPVEAADRLFNRVMTAVAAGDSTEAQQFMPMAIGAYERARPLNNDGLFHLSMLQRTAMQLEAALETAEEILEDNSDHLLGLSAAAKAATELGRGDIAAAYYGRVLEVYESQIEQDIAEYMDHAPITDNLRTEAEAFLGGR